jgi:hypothetical protein
MTLFGKNAISANSSDRFRDEYDEYTSQRKKAKSLDRTSNSLRQLTKEAEWLKETMSTLGWKRIIGPFLEKSGDLKALLRENISERQRGEVAAFWGFLNFLNFLTGVPDKVLDLENKKHQIEEELQDQEGAIEKPTASRKPDAGQS